MLDSLGLSDIVSREEEKEEEEKKEGMEVGVAESISGDRQQQQHANSINKTPPRPLVQISLKYVLLSKVNKVRIQPVHNLFANVGPVKQVLEENLRYHSTLTVNDVLTVYYRGKEHVLTVRDMCLDSDNEEKIEEEEENKMEVDESITDADATDMINNKTDALSAVGRGGATAGVRGGSLINTDVVVDIDVSEEYLNQPQQKPQQSAAIGAGEDYSGSVSVGSSGGRKLGGGAEVVTPSLQQQEFQQEQREGGNVNVTLEEEPGANISPNDVITCKIKTPQGKTFTRRFEKKKPLHLLFAFVRYVLQTHQLPGPGSDHVLQLSTRQPVRRFTEEDVEHVNVTQQNSTFNRSSGSDSALDKDRGNDLDTYDTTDTNVTTFLSAGIDSSHELFFVAFV